MPHIKHPNCPGCKEELINGEEAVLYNRGDAYAGPFIHDGGPMVNDHGAGFVWPDDGKIWHRRCWGIASPTARTRRSSKEVSRPLGWEFPSLAHLPKFEFCRDTWYKPFVELKRGNFVLMDRGWRKIAKKKVDTVQISLSSVPIDHLDDAIRVCEDFVDGERWHHTYIFGMQREDGKRKHFVSGLVYRTFYSRKMVHRYDWRKLGFFEEPMNPAPKKPKKRTKPVKPSKKVAERLGVLLSDMFDEVDQQV